MYISSGPRSLIELKSYLVDLAERKLLTSPVGGEAAGQESKLPMTDAEQSLVEN